MKPVDMSVETVTLEKIRIGCEQLISRELLGCMVETGPGHIMRAVALKVHGYIWGQKIRTVEAKWPDGWAQAIKERFSPEWFRRRWPVRYRSVRLDATAIWPTLRMLVPDHEPRLILTKHEAVSDARD